MTEYRRNFVKGGSYFFTVALADRSQRLLVDHIITLRDAFRHVKADYPDRWRRIKAAFSRRLPDCNFRTASKIAKGERGI